jgi:uncharacterized MAPEG superfamily protein
VKTALVCLVLFALWTMVIVAAIGGWRSILVLGGKNRSNDFPAATPHGPDVYRRIHRAHLNALEVLPVFAAIVLAGYALGVDTPGVATAAQVVVGARVVQTILHVSSGAAGVVTARFLAFAAQLVALAYLAFEVLF